MAKLLLVCNNPAEQGYLGRPLIQRGHSVVLAEDGRKALELAHLELPDLILVDMDLPEPDAWDTIHRLRDDRSIRHLPVIALVGRAREEDRDRALAAGCDDFAMKRGDMGRLLAKVSALVWQ